MMIVEAIEHLRIAEEAGHCQAVIDYLAAYCQRLLNQELASLQENDGE